MAKKEDFQLLGKVLGAEGKYHIYLSDNEDDRWAVFVPDNVPLSAPEPVLIPADCCHSGRAWLYEGNLYMSNLSWTVDTDELRVRLKHQILRQKHELAKIRREVEALENLERLRTEREPVPPAVRLFVWQRDHGRCVQCGCNERLEFDHIIPLALGGANTERNIQLLCERCKR